MVCCSPVWHRLCAIRRQYIDSGSLCLRLFRWRGTDQLATSHDGDKANRLRVYHGRTRSVCRDAKRTDLLAFANDLLVSAQTVTVFTIYAVDAEIRKSWSYNQPQRQRLFPACAAYVRFGPGTPSHIVQDGAIYRKLGRTRLQFFLPTQLRQTGHRRASARWAFPMPCVTTGRTVPFSVFG